MKAGFRKKVEIGIWASNLVVFVIVNLFVLRVFHWISTLIMAVPLLITILFTARRSYVDWEKKSPSILKLTITFCVCVVSSVISNIPDISEYVSVAFFLISKLSAVLSFIFFIKFMIAYSSAYNEHKKELELDKKQHLYNLSIPVLIAFILIIVWSVTVSFIDKMSTVSSPRKYESEITGSDYEFFPASLPENAKNKEFKKQPGFWLAKSKAYIRFETTKEYVNEYELLHGADTTNVNNIDAWSERHIEESWICKLVNDDYLNKDNCDVYVKTEGHSIQGYAINRDTNEIFAFYDGFD